MFDNLSEKLQRVFKNLRGEGKLSAENMESALREIRMALLEADVNFRVVKQLLENIKQKAMGEEVLAALSPSQQVVKIVHEELIKILGSHESKLRFANEPPSVFLIVGLQGSGKTTTTGKLARWLSRNGHRPMMVSVDVYRPAAREQLKVIAREIGQPLYEGAPEEKQPLELARAARRESANTGRDVLLVDTAGRLHIDDQLMSELQQLKAAAQSGRDSVRGRRHDRAGRGEIGRRVPQAAGHHRRDPHQDGWRCARRRGALHPPRHRPAAEIRRRGREVRRARAVPSRTARPTASWAWATSSRSSRRPARPIDKKKAVEMQRKLIENEFTLEDFRDQLRQIRKLGPLSSLLDMMPKVGMLKDLKDVKVDEKEIEPGGGDHRFDDPARARQSHDHQRQPPPAHRAGQRHHACRKSTSC